MKEQILQQGIPILPKEVQGVKTLDTETAKDIMNRFTEKYISSQSKYSKEAKDALTRHFELEDGVLKGSSTLTCTALSPIMDEMGLPLADIVSVGNALAVEPDAFRGIYVDLGSVLYSVGAPNEFYAKSIGKQIEDRGAELQFPMRIDFSGSSIKPNSKAPYKLDIVLGDANVVHAPELSKGGKFKQIVDGKPVFDRTGDKTLYVGSSGLSWFYLDRDLGLYSDGSGLAYSDSGGRVVHSDKVPMQSFVDRINTSWQSQLDAARAKIQEASNILKGN